MLLNRIPAVERAVPLLRGRGAQGPLHTKTAPWTLRRRRAAGGAAPPLQVLPATFRLYLRACSGGRAAPPLRARSQWNGQRNRLLPSLRGRARCLREREPGPALPLRPEGSTRAGVRRPPPEARLCQGVKPSVRAGLLCFRPQSEHLQMASCSQRLKDVGWGLFPLKCWKQNEKTSDLDEI